METIKPVYLKISQLSISQLPRKTTIIEFLTMHCPLPGIQAPVLKCVQKDCDL